MDFTSTTYSPAGSDQGRMVQEVKGQELKSLSPDPIFLTSGREPGRSDYLIVWEMRKDSVTINH